MFFQIYHDFYDEVDNYKQHWWLCNGPCQKKPPYFGLVKRSMNRAPSPHDFWYNDHNKNCGGTFSKIKEPEGFGEKKKQKKDEKEDASKVNQKGIKHKLFKYKLTFLFMIWQIYLA